MNENTENTLSAYLGPEFQTRLMWQILVEPEFAEEIIPNLAVEYFDDPNFKRLFIIIVEYYKEYEKVPNLQNKSIHQAINEYKTPNNQIEEESLFSVLKRIELWNERIINKQMYYDGDAVQKSTQWFIKQQEYRKLAEEIITDVKTGDIKSKYKVNAIEEKFQKISHIGEEKDDCESVTEGIEKALRKEFRETIPTGIGAIDDLTGGGLGKGEIGVILAPSGVGKTTALTVIADTAYKCDKNVAHIVFEDTKDQIKRKHYVIWAESALSKLEDNAEHDRVLGVAKKMGKDMEGRGRLFVKRFSQEDTTMRDIRNWMINYEKKFGFKFDMLVLDYLDCVESHKRTPDRHESELAVIKGFESLAADFDIPAWTAIQSNRSGIGAEFVEAQQTGGNIKRMQKAHFFMSIAKTPSQQEANFANIRIIKARFAKDGQMFEDCVFNNDTMQIIIDDPRYRNTRNYKNLKHYTDEEVDTFNEKAGSHGKLHSAISAKQEELTGMGGADINNMLHQNLLPEQSHDPPETDDKQVIPVQSMNPPTGEGLIMSCNKSGDAINEAVNDAVTEEILELDGDVTISDKPPEDPPLTVGDIKDNKLLDWTGETETIKESVEKIDVDSTQFKPPTEANNNENNLSDENLDLSEIEKNLTKDPDEPDGYQKTVYEMLREKGSNQRVIQKE